jgi:hypothetical protein
MEMVILGIVPFHEPLFLMIALRRILCDTFLFYCERLGSRDRRLTNVIRLRNIGKGFARALSSQGLYSFVRRHFVWPSEAHAASNRPRSTLGRPHAYIRTLVRDVR